MFDTRMQIVQIYGSSNSPSLEVASANGNLLSA